jgi:glycosyltransferase involved in cell wall biosynthesis
MTVSVCMITYNHEKYIRQAIEGIILQQTGFAFELVIGEDCSTDRTRAICEEYALKYPQRIRLLPSDKNYGMVTNLVRILEACTGKYVAICEGDDYWTDPLKLQKQVDFLEANPEYAICFHRVDELEKGEIKRSGLNKSEKEETYTIEDLARGNFISTPSVIFRNGLIREFPKWFTKSPVGDYVLHMLNARFGKIKYFSEPMAVYRRHGQGAWGLRKAEENSLSFIKVIDFLIPEFDGPVKDILIKQKAGIFSQLATIKYYERNVEKAKEYIENAFLLDESLKERWLRDDYPTVIQNLFNSRRYKAADKLAHYLNKFS